MKRLFLTRHAKSSWDHPDLRDIDRPLNKRGLRDAPMMGQELEKRGLIPEAILISPSRRTRATAGLLATEFSFAEDQIEIIDSFYGASESEVIHRTRKLPDSLNSAMLIGHNPTWTALINRLSSGHLVNLPTCGIAIIDFECDQWSHFDDQTGILRHSLFPRQFKK